MNRGIGLSAAIGVQTPGQLTLTVAPNFLGRNNAPFAIRYKHAANVVSYLRMPIISYVLDADSGL